jgi:predicted dinucleotide-binding enzyme
MCRNDEQAKKTVTGILDSFGWETVDMRGIEGSHPLKLLAMLWIVNRKNWCG